MLLILKQEVAEYRIVSLDESEATEPTKTTLPIIKEIALSLWGTQILFPKLLVHEEA